MKIFMVHEDPWHAGNPYIYTLIEELQRQHIDCVVSWGRDLFWSDEIYKYDIVHFHWPQAFMAGDSHSEKDLKDHIEQMSIKGVRIVSTCHDLEPHYKQCSEYAASIQIVYSHCDTIFHLGAYSKSLFEEKYPNIRHLLLPHHVYDTVYTTFPNRDQSLTYLKLPKDKKYILCFGTFRGDEERMLVINLYKQLKTEKIAILAPGFMDVRPSKKTIGGFVDRIKKYYYQYRYHIYCSGKTFAPISDAELPYYYGASDIAFIQRLKILNSGNAIMPLLMKKVVVGPNTGNVGFFLKSCRYPLFDINNLDNIHLSVEEGMKMRFSNIIEDNYETALRDFSTKIISEKLFNYYELLLKNI